MSSKRAHATRMSSASPAEADGSSAHMRLPTTVHAPETMPHSASVSSDAPDAAFLVRYDDSHAVSSASEVQPREPRPPGRRSDRDARMVPQRCAWTSSCANWDAELVAAVVIRSTVKHSMSVVNSSGFKRRQGNHRRERPNCRPRVRGLRGFSPAHNIDRVGSRLPKRPAFRCT
eukprot:scaffold10054_cov133-Isochrysis_galbana.AAC.5